MKHTKLPKEAVDQLIKNIQIGVDTNESFKAIRLNYAHYITYEADKLIRTGFTNSESNSIIERALYIACIRYDFRDGGSIWALVKFQIKTEIYIEMDSLNGKGLMAPRECPTDKELNPYTCNNLCGEQGHQGNLPCRVNKRKGFNTLDLYAEPEKDRIETSFDCFSDLPSQTHPELLPPTNKGRIKYEMEKLAEEKILDAVERFPEPLKDVFTDYLHFTGYGALGIKALSKKYKTSKSNIKMMVNEGFTRLRSNHKPSIELML